ncbi:hypothetical protein D3C76_224380 [compost metagenome]
MVRILRVAQIQLRLDPLVMRQFELPGCIEFHALEIVDESLGDLGKQRCLAAVGGVEMAHTQVPTGIAQGLPHHRKTTGQQTFDCAVEQLAVDLQTARLDTRWWRMPVRIAQVAGKDELLLTQDLIHATHLPLPAAGYECARSRRAARPAADN